MQLALLLLLLFVQQTFSTLSTSPLFLWSGSSHLSAKDDQVDTFLSSVDLVDGLGRLSGLPPQNPVNSLHVKAKSQPEVVVVFFAPQASNIGIATGSYDSSIPCTLPYLKEMIKEKSVTSLVAPYVSLDSLSLKQQLRLMFNSLSEEQAVLALGPNAASLFFTVKHQNKKLITLEQLSAELIFNNGVTDFVFVMLSSVESPQVVETMNTITAGTSDYVAILGMETQTEQARLMTHYHFSQPKIHFRGTEFYTRDSSSDDDGGSQYWPPDVLEAVIMCVIYAPILLIGICCTCNLPSPDRFEGGAQRERQYGN